MHIYKYWGVPKGSWQVKRFHYIFIFIIITLVLNTLIFRNRLINKMLIKF